MRLSANNISRTFQGEAGLVLDDVTLNVKSGELYVIAGKSGCGKSTLLRILGGFDKPNNGMIYLDSQLVSRPQHTRMMVFQSFDQLFPWFTLEQNLVFALRKSKVEPSREKAKIKAFEFLQKTGLEKFAKAYPATLSGGMLQRGALARALCLEPKVLLMDEPFSSLDAITRKSMQDLLLQLKSHTDAAIILVTHDIDEAVRLADTLAVLKRGQSGLISCPISAKALEEQLA